MREIKYIFRQTRLSYALLIKKIVASFGLRKPSSGQNIYKNLNSGVYSVLFVSVMGSHLLSYSSLELMPAVVVYTPSPCNFAQYTYLLI